MPPKTVKTIKALGQHFLHNQAIAQRIVDAIPTTEQTQLVFEVGPGEGVLTQYLLQRPDIDLYVVELDRRLPPLLLQRFAALQGRIIEQDVLRLRFDDYAQGRPFTIVGNFPYNISSQIVFQLLTHKHQAAGLVGMFQREVAERICAAPGSKTYGVLSPLTQAYYHTEYLLTVPPTEFRPPPKVQSGVIRLLRSHLHDGSIVSERHLQQVVKMAFNQRRKKLSNALANLALDKTQLPPALFDLRAEQLSVTDFIALANAVISPT